MMNNNILVVMKSVHGCYAITDREEFSETSASTVIVIWFHSMTGMCVIQMAMVHRLTFHAGILEI